MSIFEEPILDAIIVFPIICLVLYLPFMLIQYHRYGVVTAWHTLMTVSFVFYLTSAFFVVNLPLPTAQRIQHLIAINYPTMNLDPLNIFKSFIKSNPMMNGGSLLAGLLDSTVTQVLLNILLTIPFGLYLRVYYKQSFKKTLLFTFLLTSFFELTQLTGLYHIYARPYRLFDVDDLILNTLGGIIGWACAPILGKVFPSQERMNRVTISQQDSFTLIRRVIAFVLDVALNLIICLVCLAVFPNHLMLINFVANIIIWGIVPALTSKTLGQRLVKVVTQTHHQQNWRTIIRHLSVIGFINVLLPSWMTMLIQIV